MSKVLLTVTESSCRSGYHRAGEKFIVDDLCPPVCQELWNNMYPYIFALKNGASLDFGDDRAMEFDAVCPDGGRVKVHGELLPEDPQD